MSKVYTSYEEMCRAYDKVRGELIGLGLLWDGSRLDGVECHYGTLNPLGLIGWMGFYEPIDDGDGNIHFPAVYNGLDLRFRWTDKMSTVDVLRHEFGHALADRYPGVLKKNGVFRAAFGGHYCDESAPGTDPEDWEGRCVSRYAATNTQEDFAETFKLFMKHRGKIPAKFAGKPAIRRKWKAVATIVKAVVAAAS